MVPKHLISSVAALIVGIHCGLGHAAQVRHSARIAHVLDVSTYVVDIELDDQTTRITLGLSDVDAPKIYGAGCERAAARRAKAFVQDILRPDDQVIVHNLRRREGRFVGDIEFDGRDLRDVLVRFQQVTQAGAPAPWCDAGGAEDTPT